MRETITHTTGIVYKKTGTPGIKLNTSRLHTACGFRCKVEISNLKMSFMEKMTMTYFYAYLTAARVPTEDQIECVWVEGSMNHPGED